MRWTADINQLNLLHEKLKTKKSKRICSEVSKVHKNTGKRFRAAVSVLVGPCCPTLLNCIDADVHTVVLSGK